jgi:hypothetical protein
MTNRFKYALVCASIVVAAIVILIAIIAFGIFLSTIHPALTVFYLIFVIFILVFLGVYYDK